MGRFSSRFMNCALVGLAILGILFIISGHSESFLNREGFVNIGDISPGNYPGENGLLGSGYPLLKTKKRGIKASCPNRPRMALIYSCTRACPINIAIRCGGWFQYYEWHRHCLKGYDEREPVV